MNAFNTVNLAAACILTSTDEAKKLGIPENRWVYPRSGAGEKDSDHCKIDCLGCSCDSTNRHSLGAAELLLQPGYFMVA